MSNCGEGDARGDAAASAEAQKRRRAAVEALYRDHWRALCVRLRRVFGDGPPDPEDLAQTAFAKFIERADIGELDNPASFLFRIAINEGRDRIRHIVRSNQLITSQLTPPDGADVEQITPLVVYEARQDLQITTDAFNALSQKQQEVIARSRLRGETFAEISAATGWSKADISRTLKSALGALQTALQDASPPDET